MIVKVSKARYVNGPENDFFLGRVAAAQDEGRVSNPDLVDAMLRRGCSRRKERRKALHELDGDYN